MANLDAPATRLSEYEWLTREFGKLVGTDVIN
jgi:hypothetical protein